MSLPPAEHPSAPREGPGGGFRLPTQIPLEEYPPPEVFIEEAERLVEEARKRNLPLRVMGGMAVYMRCPPEFREVWKALKRLGDRVFTDIDFVSYGKYKEQMIDLMGSQGYRTDAQLVLHAGKNRQIFYGGRVPMVEIFYDRLAMNHTLDYQGRLEADTLTVPLAELMLQKLQIVKLNDKDVKDLVVLFATHGLGSGNAEMIDVDFVTSKYMQSDWGFYWTATNNLTRVGEALKRLNALKEDEKMAVAERIAKILQTLNDAPKTRKWKLRARVGPKVQWYNDVDEWW